jgi:CubicO group peptidase (beta-lactamase class C family)
MKATPHAAIVASVVLAFVGPGFGAERAGGFDPITEKSIDSIFAPWDNTRSPGCAIAISRQGRIVFSRGYGMANLELGVPITPASIFHVASISKQFTAACVALLAAEGRVSWADDIRKYVPELPDYGHRITLAHLAHHTSGLRDQWTLLRLADWRNDDLITEADVLKIAVRQKAVNFAPGDEFLYSNTGYTLLAIVVHRVSGQTLRDFADARLFTPLDMRSTHFHGDHTEIVHGRTSAYEPRRGGGLKISIPVFDTYGATSLFTTAGDLLKWQRSLVEARVGGRDFVDALMISGRLNDGKDTGYGFGLSTRKWRGITEVGHAGADAGYRAHLA